MALKDDCQDCPEIRLINQKLDMQIQQITEDIDELKENGKWIKRLIITSIFSIFSSIATTAIILMTKLK